MPIQQLSASTQTLTTTELVTQIFENPDFYDQAIRLEEPDTIGRMGRNKQYQMYSSPDWQKNVWLYAQESLANKNLTQVDLSIKAMEFAFDQQLSNGDFAFAPVPGIPAEQQLDVGIDGHSGKRGNIIFIAAVASSIEAFQESQWFQTSSENQANRERLTSLLPKIQKALDYLASDKVFPTLQNDIVATNRIWFYALAFYGAGKITGNTQYQQIGLNFAQKAMSQFNPTTGIFLENGGGDSSYQAVSLVNASRFSFLLPDQDSFRTRIQQAVISGAAWEQSKILSTGEVSTAGNTRVYPGGESFMGQTKIVDVPQVILGLTYAAQFSNQQTYWDKAQGIINFYNAGGLSFGATTFSVGEDGLPVAAVTVIRTFGSKGIVSATVSYNNGTASDSDYNKTPILVTFADGDTASKVIKIPINNDNIYELNETIKLSLSYPTGGVSIGTQKTAVLTILDNDPLPKANFSSGILSQNEGNSITYPTTFTLTVNLSNPSSQTISIPYMTSNGTAIAGTDYIANNGTLSFTPGQISKNITVKVYGNTIVQPDKTFTVNLGSPTNAVLGTAAKSTATIVNDDTNLSFSSSIFTLNEDGTPVLPVTVSRTGSSKGTVDATLSYNNGTASDSDYNKTPIVVTFADGDTAPKVINVPINNDNIYEPNETINLSLSYPHGGSIGTQKTAVLTILDDDPLPKVTINPKNVILVESNQGTTALTFTVNLSNPSSQTITVPYTTQNGTAIAETDYITNNAILTFTPGQTSKNIAVKVNGDNIIEPNETFSFKLGMSTNAVLGTIAQSTVTIVDNNSGSGNTLIGGSGNDLLVGGAGADILTGGGGSDIFQFKNLSDSLLNTYDRITDLQIGTDIIRGPSTMFVGSIGVLGSVASLQPANISALLTSTNFLANHAVAFTIGTGTLTRTFLGLNDGVNGFSANTDSIIEITGYGGGLQNLALS